LYAQAATELSISLADFDNLTPRLLVLMIEKRRNAESQNFRQGAELKRILALQLANAVIDPRHFIRFAWEDDPAAEISEELLNTPWEVLDSIYAN